MTDKQLYMLMRHLSERVRELALRVEETIKDGDREYENVWIGEGPEPKRGLLGMPDVSLAISNFGKNYEARPVGRFSAVVMIENFADELEGDALLLAKPERDADEGE